MTSTDWRSAPPHPLPAREWSFPRPTVRVLDNGLRLLCARHGNAPLVSLRAIVRAGGSSDPEGRSGLAALVADLLDEGAGQRDTVALAEDLGQLGAYAATGADWDASYVFLETLARYTGETCAIFADMVRRPRFSDAAIDRVVSERLNTIVQQKDDPAAVAGKLFSRFLFEASRYGTPLAGEPETLEAITRYDIAGLHAEIYRPSNTSIVATGAVEPDETLDMLESLFGDWEPKEVTVSFPPAPGKRDPGPVYLIDRPGSVQSEIRIGHLGVSRSTEDYFPLIVMNAILGDLFNSRIMLNLRERHGFTYGARSSFIFRRHAGPFVVSTAVRNEVTRDAVREILAEIERMREDEVDDEELDLARRFLSGAFPSTVQTGADLARRLQEMELYDLPADYFDHYQSRVESVTREDIGRVAREYLAPDTALILVVGAGSEIAEALGELGREVHRFDIEGTAMV